MALYDFVIVCHQRSGSHLLASFLDSHPSLCCLDEAGAHLYNDTPCKDWDFRGRIFMYNNFLKRKELIKIPRFVHLTRKLRATAFSCCRNSSLRQQHGVLHKAFLLNGDSKQKRVQDFEAPSKSMRTRSWQIKKQRSRVSYKLRKLDVHKIRYEEMTEDSNSVSVMPPEIADRLCEFLGVKPAPLTTKLVKIAPQNVRVLA
jgi:hypothetical protein